MERTIFDIMTDDASKIDEFKNAVDEMLGAKYILAEGRISAILKTVATSKVLYSLFDRLLAGFDYKAVAKSCMTESNTKIRLPQSTEDTAAFIFCVLLDMDKRNIELKDFLHFFHGGTDNAHAYNVFLKEFIAPFKASVLSLLDADRRLKEEKLSAEQKAIERRKLEANFDKFMGTFIARINSAELNSSQKDDLCELCREFSESVHGGDVRVSRASYAKLIKKLKATMPPLAKELEKFDIENV